MNIADKFHNRFYCIKIWQILVLLFCGCAHYEYISLPNFNQKTFEVIHDNDTYLLYVSHTDERYIFAMFDTLGSPIAHKELRDNRFSNIRFLPPKAIYDDLFYRTLEMIQRDESSINIKTNDTIIQVKEI